MNLKRRNIYVQDLATVRGISERVSAGEETSTDKEILKGLTKEYDPSGWTNTNADDWKDLCYGLIKAIVWAYITERVTPDVWEEMSEWEGSGSQGVFESPYGLDLINAVWRNVDNFWTGMKFLGK